MDNWTDLDKVDILRFALSVEKDCQEAVKWEVRKLEWILSDTSEKAVHEEAA